MGGTYLDPQPPDELARLDLAQALRVLARLV